MNCSRCRGLMVTTVLMDAGSSTDSFSGWQCLQCGEVTDPGITANRKHHLEPRRNGARPPGSLPVSGTSARRKRD